MKKTIAFTLTLLLLFTMCSCVKYTSSYTAVGLFKNQTSHSCEARFSSLEGQLVFKIQKSGNGEEGNISYRVEIEEGEIFLYYDIYGQKEELAHAQAGESIEDFGGYVEGGKQVYIIIEGIDNAKGKIFVELDH